MKVASMKIMFMLMQLQLASDYLWHHSVITFTYCIYSYILKFSFLLSVPATDTDDKMIANRQRVGFEVGSEEELDKNVCILSICHMLLFLENKRNTSINLFFKF